MTTLPVPIQNALDFEKANWTNGCSVLDDSFYLAPSDAAQAAPGTLLKVQTDIDTTQYMIPPATALSRIMYQSETLHGARVPVTAFVLWPYSPRAQPDGHPVVAWAHGTSGADASAAPSHLKNLWQHFLAPYQIALQGYVVVATDYAGLGVGKHPSGEPIPHDYLGSPANANDVVYSVIAARAAFKELSKEFVVIGHSQGGGAAWAVAQREAKIPVPGYLGSVAVSPYTSLLDEPGKFSTLVGAAMCPSIAAAIPDFDPKDLLTPEGQGRVGMMFQTGAGIACSLAMFLGTELLKPGWKENQHFLEHQSLTSNGGKPIKGPLLVIHGEADPRLSYETVERAVHKTAEMFPSAQLEFVTLPHVTHAPALPASQRRWMDWIADRFAGREVQPGVKRSELARARPDTAYQKEQNWYLEAASTFYHAP